jgi:hypothetical protein
MMLLSQCIQVAATESDHGRRGPPGSAVYLFKWTGNTFARSKLRFLLASHVGDLLA